MRCRETFGIMIEISIKLFFLDGAFGKVSLPFQTASMPLAEPTTNLSAKACKRHWVSGMIELIYHPNQRSPQWYQMRFGKGCYVISSWWTLILCNRFWGLFKANIRQCISIPLRRNLVRKVHLYFCHLGWQKDFLICPWGHNGHAYRHNKGSWNLMEMGT